MSSRLDNNQRTTYLYKEKTISIEKSQMNIYISFESLFDIITLISSSSSSSMFSLHDHQRFCLYSALSELNESALLLPRFCWEFYAIDTIMVHI